ncbi:MAG: hypothetical protein QOG52_601, partial [Frankiaceae bacterium]|nr:hypothetical protein [Frankiaceae bacterium]
PSPTEGAAPPLPTATSGDTFLDDTLATALAPDGRLGALVAGAARAAKQRGAIAPRLPPAAAPLPGSGAATAVKPQTAPVVEKLIRRPVPVTWAIDPDLLESAQSMAGGYVVHDGAVTRRGSAASVQTAAQWLTAITAAVGTSPVIPLPYADADLVALARAGRADEVSRVLRPSTDADSVFRTVLSRQVAPSIVWPVGGSLTQDTLDILARQQVSAVVLSDNALPVRDPLELTATPGMQGPSLVAGGGTVQPLVSDQTLDGLIAADPSADDVGLAQQRFLAETAMITAEAPSNARDILLLPPRHPTNTAFLSGLLALTGQVPWLNGITVDDALRHPVDPTDRGPLTYSNSAKSAEVSRAVISASYATRGRLAMLGSILDFPDVLAPTDRGLLRTYSASWRQDPRMAETVRASASSAVEDWIKKVSVLTSGQALTLLSKSAKIPLTITNGLDQGVHGVRVQLKAVNTAYMDVVRADNVPVKAHDRTPLFLPANIPAVGSVRFDVVVSLLTPSGQTLSWVPLQVHSTGSGGTVLLVTLILMGLLFLVVAVRLVRRFWKYYAARGALA